MISIQAIKRAIIANQNQTMLLVKVIQLAVMISFFLQEYFMIGFITMVTAIVVLVIGNTNTPQALETGELQPIKIKC